MLGLLAALALCIIVLVLVLPRGAATTQIKGGGRQNITNITSPLTTISPTTINQLVVYTTTVTIQGNQTINQSQSNYSEYLGNLTGYPTTTVLYVYCVGSPLPPYSDSYYSSLGSDGAEGWINTTSYPTPFLSGSCASSAGYLYCIGPPSSRQSNNITTRVYYAPISEQGIGNWQRTTNYPIPFLFGSCAIANSYIYCVGTSSTPYASDVFYAPVSPGGIGEWRATTPYPAPFYGAQCNTNNGYIYCIGDTHINVSGTVAYYRNLSGNTSAAEQLLNSGDLPTLNLSPECSNLLGWSGPMETDNIASAAGDGGSCTISDSVIYCVGGSTAAMSIGEALPNHSALDATTNMSAYFSSLFSNESSATIYAGIAANGSVKSWNYTAPYPEELRNSECYRE